MEGKRRRDHVRNESAKVLRVRGDANSQLSWRRAKAISLGQDHEQETRVDARER
jgi:hypothetical protein